MPLSIRRQQRRIERASTPTENSLQRNRQQHRQRAHRSRRPETPVQADPRHDDDRQPEDDFEAVEHRVRLCTRPLAARAGVGGEELVGDDGEGFEALGVSSMVGAVVNYECGDGLVPV